MASVEIIPWAPGGKQGICEACGQGVVLVGKMLTPRCWGCPDPDFNGRTLAQIEGVR